MTEVTRHPAADKEIAKLPAPLRERVLDVEQALRIDPYLPARRAEKGWGHRKMLVAALRLGHTDYRLAYEIVSEGDVFIWMVGAHEGFYQRLARRAGRA